MQSSLPPPFYYLENFQRVLDWIAQRYNDFLSDQEISFLKNFPILPEASRALLVRMVIRKGDLFRHSKLRYPEIDCTNQAVEPLVDLGWITRNPSLNIGQLFGLLRKPELVDAFKNLNVAKQTKKSDLLQQLRSEFNEARPLRAWFAETDDTIYALNVMPVCERLRLMYFGNLHQDWSEFVLSDLGIYRYEKVEFSASSRGFGSRQEVDDYLHLYRCREQFEQALGRNENLDANLNADWDKNLNEILLAIPKSPYQSSWLEGRRNKLLYRIAQHCERAGKLPRALELYRDCDYQGARLRTIRVLEKSDDPIAAYALVETALSHAESESEYQALQRILPRLRRKLGFAKVSVVKDGAIAEQTASLPYPSAFVSVEQTVQTHLSSEQSPVFYVENALINSLFGLLCWPAIFAAIPGAFFHPFHHAPADLYSADFLQKRRPLFDACLAQLDDDSHQQTIIDIFRTKAGIQSPFVFWDVINEALLLMALHCIPAAHLKKYFARLMRDISANRSGLPDLIQFWPTEKRYLMLEVKGPGDRLQDNQIRWISYCNQHALPVAVIYVHWLESPT